MHDIYTNSTLLVVTYAWCMCVRADASVRRSHATGASGTHLPRIPTEPN
jgi:hypothetical protein